MHVAALYDIHGNLPALDAVLAEVDTDLILVGGDAVAGPWPSETLERLRELGERVRFIRGNADREVRESQREGKAPPELMKFVREQLNEEQFGFLGTWPLTESIDVDGLGAVLFCHATPTQRRGVAYAYQRRGALARRARGRRWSNGRLWAYARAIRAPDR